MITKEDLIIDLRIVSESISRIPSKSEYEKFGKYGKNTICRKFCKSWSESILEVFGENHRAYPERKESKCENASCGKIFLSGVGKNRKRFCSVSCSNKTRIRRVGTKEEVELGVAKKEKKKRFCRCGVEVCGRKTVCISCSVPLLGNRTLESFKHLKDANRYGQIREDARKVARDIPDRCHHCGYDAHVEVCHIKEIGKFLMIHLC